MLFNIIPENLIARKNETELVVYLKNGSIIQLKGSDDPDALRGPNPFGVILDEFDTQKIDAWGVLEPILRANGGWAWFVGTPKGKSHLYDFYHRGQANHPEWKSWILKASTSGIIAPDQLAEARKSMPEPLYRQEFECAFNEAQDSVFRGVKNIMTSQPEPPKADHLYVMGVDLAKVQDYTVIRVYDRDQNNLVYRDKFQTLEWPFQKSKIASIARHYNNAVTIIDATGVGDPICDDLLRAGVSVIPFKISSVTKKDIIEKLSIWIEQQKIKLLPSDEDLLEYDNFSYKILPLGQIRYEARQGFHDDVVLADALAVWHLTPVYIAEVVKEPTPTQIALQRAKSNYIRQLEDAEDGADPDFSEWSDIDENGSY